MTVTKRDGLKVKFDKDKIKLAVIKAFIDVDGEETSYAKEKARDIANYIESLDKDMTVEEIQDIVVNKLMASSRKDVAAKYVEYRYKRKLVRESNTTDKTILEIIEGDSDYWNGENSNKNPRLNTTIRDYMAGETSTDISRRILLPKEVIEAHDKGEIHFHDMDYFAQHMHNCFHEKTKFLTSDGVKSFNEFNDGTCVKVLDKNGEWRDAIVRNYGKKLMNEVTFTTSKMKKTVVCTSDHRWLLKDGTVTTNLKIGDTLLPVTNTTDRYSIETYHDCDMFTIGFLIGDGCDHIGSNLHQIRLCGHKTEYAKYFEKAGYKVTPIKDTKDLIAIKRGYKKQDFLNSKAWKYMSENDKRLLFLGLYAADGRVGGNKLCTTDNRIAEFIEDTSYFAGYYISSKNIEVRDTQYKENSELMAYHFITHQPNNLCWKISSIKPYHSGTEYSAWCVEEPITHSFMLEGGMITGNCDLINLEDMLQNNTVISETLIESPHSFSTACTVATQIIAQVASAQYGGQSVSLAHLAPFVDVSRKAIRKEVTEELYDNGFIHEYDENLAEVTHITNDRLNKEIKKGIQTIQYQVVTLMTTNGQAPFLTLFMYLNEAKTEQEKNDLAMLIEETLNQRYQGVKNEKGVWISPAFPKIIYVLEEDNITENSKYWYLTKLAAKCSAKRLVPDYISEKVMKELKDGNCYPVMGCVDGKEIVSYKYLGNLYVESFERMWNRLSDHFEIKHQFNENNPNVYMDLQNIEIYDTEKGFVNTERIIRNISSNWVDVHFSNGRRLLCTTDHPFEVYNKGVVKAENLSYGNKILINSNEEMISEHYNTYSEVVEVIPVEKTDYSYDVTTESGHFEVSGIYSHNCRSALTVWKDENGNPKFYGRFNQGVVTINLVDIALSSEGDFNKFWELFDERTELCHKALQCRHERLEGTSSDVAPILWQYGALARLDRGEKIDKLLHGGYSTISLGYAGLYECVKYMTGFSHSDEGVGEEFGLKVMQSLNDKCKQWKEAENIDYSLYGTPLESTTYKFAKLLKKKFGEDIFIKIDNHDRNYITNSYHVPVFEEIDAFEKLRIEAKFQRLSPGGAISYIETPNMNDNIDAVLEVIKFIYDNIMYAELNTKSDYCQVCGYDGEINLIDENNKLLWECPKCHNRDPRTMNITRRTCGYIGTGTNGWNQGRLGDIHDRVLHLDNIEYKGCDS